MYWKACPQIVLLLADKILIEYAWILYIAGDLLYEAFFVFVIAGSNYTNKNCFMNKKKYFLC